MIPLGNLSDSKVRGAAGIEIAISRIASNQPLSMGKRYWEVDAIRGFALFSMIAYHVAACMVIFHMLIEDEAFFSIYNSIWLTSGAFVFISGTALVLRYARKNGDLRAYHISIMKKALFLFAIAMGITCISWMADFLLFEVTGRFIKFGFMHMLSISMFLSIPFLKLGRWNIIPGLAVILTGIFAVPLLQDPAWLYPLGIHSADFMDFTQDYFPLFPWFGVMLLGIGIGSILYPNGIRRWALPEPGVFGRAFAAIGNGNVTLAVYLVHVPVIFGILWIIHLMTGSGYL